MITSFATVIMLFKWDLNCSYFKSSSVAVMDYSPKLLMNTDNWSLL